MKTFNWCPLFGTLPDCTDYAKWDGITENCIKIIADARQNLGTPEYISGMKKPDPERVEKYTGFPAAWIRSARLVCYNSCEILYKAQFRFLDAHAVTNRDGEEFMTVDVDQIGGRNMVLAIEQMVIFSGARDWNITPERAFSLMAIGEAWRAIRDLGNGKDPEGKRSATNLLMRAEKLLNAVTVCRLDKALENLMVADLKSASTRGKSTAARKKRRHWGDLTQDEMSERNKRIFEHFKTTRLSRSSFANKHAAKYGLKSRQVMYILKMAVCSLPG